MAVSAVNYKQMFETSPVAIFIYQDGFFRTVNPVMAH